MWDQTLATVEEERELVVKLTTDIAEGLAADAAGHAKEDRRKVPTETVVYITDKGKKA